MRAATLLVAVLCATLPAVHGREKPSTSQFDSPHPEVRDDTVSEKTEDPNAAGQIKQALSVCREERPSCKIHFIEKENGGCQAVADEPTESNDGSPASSQAQCFDEKGYGRNGAVCSCSSSGCNANTFFEALAELIGPEKTPWLDQCRKALEDQLERASNVENQEIRTNRRSNMVKTAKPPTSTAPSASDPISADANNQKSDSCQGNVSYQTGVTKNDGPSYCGYEFTKADDKSCSAVALERFVKGTKKELSEQGSTLCAGANPDRIMCLCEGKNCNSDATAISEKLKAFLQNDGTKWKNDCLKQLLDQIAREKSTTSKDTARDEENQEEGTATEAPTGRPSIPTTTISSSAPVTTQIDTKSTAAEIEAGPESTPAVGGLVTIDSHPESSSAPSTKPNPINIEGNGDSVETSEPPTTPPTATTSEGIYLDDDSDIFATTSQSPDDFAGQVNPSTQPPVDTPEETSTTEEPDEDPSEVKPTAVPPVETNAETTTGTTEAATTSVAATTTSQTSAKDPETTPGSMIDEAEVTSSVETPTGRAGNDEQIHNQGAQGAEGSGDQGNKEGETGGGFPGWLIALLVFLALLAIGLIIGGFILTRKKEDKLEDVEGGQKPAAPAAPEPPAQPAELVKPAPPTGPVVLAKREPLQPKQPTLREQIMKEQWEKQLKLNSALDAAKKAPAVPAVPEAVPPKKEEEKAPMGGQVQVVDEQLPVVPTQEDISLKEAPKVEAVKAETSFKEKATQGTVDSVKTQPSESHKSEKKKSSPPKELPKNDV